MGADCSPLGELTFDNFRIPASNRLGNEGDGFKICMWQLNQTRLNCAAGALGVARAAKEAAVNYCNQRVQFGQKIGEFQMNQDMIAQMIAHEEAARCWSIAPPGWRIRRSRTIWKPPSESTLPLKLPILPPTPR